MRGSNFIDRRGQRFGRLVVIERATISGRGAHWKCRCVCGGEVIVGAPNLTTGNTQSCGCLKRETISRRATTHGMKGTREYRAWQAMKNRCTLPSNRHWADYGGRGIKVCERWLDSFETFLEDVGPAPSEKHSIDRFPDTNGNYEPGNVRWATQREQCRNKRNNVVLTRNGESMTVVEWAERLGVKPGYLYKRVRRGWSDAAVLETP